MTSNNTNTFDMNTLLVSQYLSNNKTTTTFMRINITCLLFAQDIFIY